MCLSRAAWVETNICGLSGRHEAFYLSKRSQVIKCPTQDVEFHFSEGELLKVEESVKVSNRCTSAVELDL